MSDPTKTPGFANKADVFLSYARTDLDSARALVQALTDNGISVALDVTHLMPGEDYAQRLDTLLVASAKVVFLATPASLESPACKHERDLAARHAKPVLPVLAPGVAKDDLPEDLREVQYLRLGAADLVPRLVAAIRVDLAWERQHADYEQLAARGPDTVITHRIAVREAQDWLIARPQNATPVSEPVRRLIDRSQKRLRTRGRLAFFGLSAATAVLAALAIGLFAQWQEAQDQTRIAEGQTHLAEERTAQARSSLGLLYAGEAERLAGEFQTDAALLALLEASDMVAPTDTARIEATFARILTRADSERRFTIPGDSLAFEYANTLYFQVPSDGGLWRIDPQTGPARIADWPGQLRDIVPVAPLDGFPMIAATQRAGTMTLAYVDPATGRQGPQVRVEIPQMPWPVLADFEVGPDGVGMVEVRPDELHPDYTEIQDGEHDYRHFMVDVRRGFVAALEPEQLFGGDIDRPGYRLYVDAREQSHVLASYRGPDRAFVKQTLAFDDTGALIVSEDQNRDEETWRLVDCLARGLSPYDGDEMADQLQHLIASDRAGLYSEPGYSTPASGHCLWLGQSLIYVGSHGTSAGVQTNLEVLPGIGERDPGYDFASLYELNTGHFRPSLLSLTDRQVAFSALDLNDVLVIQDLNGGSTFGQWTPRHFQFPYRVGQAVLSPGGDLVAVEAPPFHASLPELRVTVLASALILEQPNDRIDEHDDLRFFVTDGPGGPELRDAEDQLVFELPPVVDSYTPLAYSASPDPAHPVVLASVDHRAVERFTRDEDGGWRRELLFVAPRYIVNLTLHPDGDLLIVGMALGGGLVEARIWSLSDRRAVGFLGENYKWMDFRVESDGSLAFVQTGAVATSVSLDEGRARAEAALAVACRPTTAGEWRSSPCWPGNL